MQKISFPPIRFSRTAGSAGKRVCVHECLCVGGERAWGVSVHVFKYVCVCVPVSARVSVCVGVRVRECKHVSVCECESVCARVCWHTFPVTRSLLLDSHGSPQGDFGKHPRAVFWVQGPSLTDVIRRGLSWARLVPQGVRGVCCGSQRDFSLRACGSETGTATGGLTGPAR